MFIITINYFIILSITLEENYVRPTLTWYITGYLLFYYDTLSLIFIRCWKYTNHLEYSNIDLPLISLQRHWGFVARNMVIIGYQSFQCIAFLRCNDSRWRHNLLLDIVYHDNGSNDAVRDWKYIKSLCAFQFLNH